MKYKRIAAFTASVILFLCCCSNSSTTINKEDSSVAEITESNPDITAETAVTYSNIENVTTEVPEETESLTWQKAYIDYIESFFEENSEIYSYFSFSLIYLDDDDIPELFVNTGGEASGEIVATFFNGQLQTEQLSRLGSEYIERSGLLYCDNGHMGHYPVYIIKLENGEFSEIGSGLRTYRAAEEGEDTFYALDENGEPINEFYWEEQPVSEDEFYENIDALFDREQGIRPERLYSVEEMISILETGACTFAGHRYELIQANVTWEEAQELCMEKGGYLATITSPDEQDAVAAQIAEEGKQDISFYVGYRYYKWGGDDFLGARWINADGSFTDAEHLYNFWEYSAPDYDARQPREWEDNDCGLVKYYDSTEQIYLFEAPLDLLTVSPEYTDFMGYICEFDE